MSNRHSFELDKLLNTVCCCGHVMFYHYEPQKLCWMACQPEDVCEHKCKQFSVDNLEWLVAHK